jgi:uncharacterized protein (TIGR03435 family)
MERPLLEFVIRTTLIAAVTGVTVWMMRIRSPGARHAAWVGVSVAMLLLPAWMAWGPKASLRVLPARSVMVTNDPPAEIAPGEDLIIIQAAPVLAAKTSRRNWSWFETFLTVYLLGAGVLLLRLAIGTIRARRLTSAACAAPVTVGLLRPRIILPESAGQWAQAQMDAVLTHERAHARRHDPLFQWLALFNRAVFWFHPLAWWLERRLAALAEEACDAAVLERGHDPREYSAHLLELARAVQRAGTRVNIVAMAMPGSYLPNRVKKIIAGVRAPKVSGTRMACATLACAIPAALFAAGTLEHAPQLLPLWPLPMRAVPAPPVLVAQAIASSKAEPAPPRDDLKFEVASVRVVDPVTPNTKGGFRVSGGPGSQDPEHIRYTQTAIFQILTRAFQVQGDQLVGPSWVTQPYGAERFEIVAKVAPNATQEQASIMMRNLLKERFHLAYHTEKKNLDVYELVIAKGGSKLKDAEIPTEMAVLPAGPALTYKGEDGYPNPPAGWPIALGVNEQNDVPAFYTLKNYAGFRVVPPTPTFSGGALLIWRFAMRMVAIPQFMLWLQEIQAIPHMVDHTGLSGQYDIRLRFSNDASSGDGGASEPAPDMFEAIEKQLGLKLQKTKAPMDIIVIDHIDKTPVEN